METMRPDDGRAPLNLPKTVEESDFTELRNCSISRRSSDSDSDGKIRDYLRHLHPPLPHEGSAKYSGATGEKSDYHDRDNDKKQPTLEKMFRALRKPSIATLEIFNNFSKVSSNSRRGSHATISNRYIDTLSLIPYLSPIITDRNLQQKAFSNGTRSGGYFQTRDIPFGTETNEQSRSKKYESTHHSTSFGSNHLQSRPDERSSKEIHHRVSAYSRDNNESVCLEGNTSSLVVTGF